MTCRCCLILLGGWGRLISPRHPLPQPQIPIIFEARSNFLCQFFLTCASRIRPSLPRGCGYWILSKPPFFPAVFDEFFTSFWSAFPFRAILLVLFPSFGFFLKAVDKDALAFSIASKDFVRAPGISNISHSADYPLVPVLLSPPPSPSPLPFMSSSPVPSSPSSSSSELSDNFDDDGSPSCPDEAYSSLSLAL